MKIIIETIPHERQRYDTVGDYFWGLDGALHIWVSALASEKMEFLVALHEMVEYMLCEHHEIGIETIDAFDMAWKPHDGIEEPGDDLAAPYYAEHQCAMGIERTVAAMLGVNWVEYERRIAALSQDHNDAT